MSAGKRRGLVDLLIRGLTRLYPSRFRDEYEEEMRVVMRTGHAEEVDARSRMGFWRRNVIGVLLGATRAHLADLHLDLRFALRSLRRRPMFVLVAVLSLGIGIGASTTVVAVFSELFWQPIPAISEADRLINVKPKSQLQEGDGGASYPYFLELVEASSTLDRLTGFTGVVLTARVGAQDEPEPHFGQVVTASYFGTLGVHAERGRLFTEAEERATSGVAIVTDWFWQNRLGARRELGAIWVNGVRVDIVGVAERGFRGNFKGFPADVYLPLGDYSIAGLPAVQDAENRVLELVGRRHEGVPISESRQELARLGELLAASDSRVYGDLGIEIEPMTGIDADFRSGLFVFLVALLAVTMLVLTVAGLNIASMMASRALERRGEVELRLALGAPRSRLLRQLVVETLVVSVLAAALGVVLAVFFTAQVGAVFASIDSRIALNVSVDRYALAATIGVASLVALFTALASGRPGWSGGSPVRRRTSTPRLFWRRSLVVGQVVLSFVVLVVAMLFLQALRSAGDLELGFEADGVVVSSVVPTLSQMEPMAAQRLFRDLPMELLEEPSIEAAALATRIPLSLGARFFPNPVEVNVPGHDPPADRDGFAIESATVSRGYFETVDLEIVSGRPPSPGEELDGLAVVVVNQNFAERFFPDGEAVGRTVDVEGVESTIVGIARDAKYRTLDEGPRAFLYRSFFHRQPGRSVVLARGRGETTQTATALREVQRRLAPELPIQELAPLEDQLATALLPQRIGASASTALGALGLFLATIGLTGIVGQWVSSRRREIGVRVSLGARPSGILRLVLRQGVGLSILGLVLGIPLALALATLLASFLYGVPATDPLSLALPAALQLAACFAATALPVLRALGVDPLEALRAE